MNQLMEFLRSRPIAAIVMLLSIVGVLACSLLFMPAAELMPAVAESPSATAPLEPGLSPVRSEKALNFFEKLAEMMWETNDVDKLAEQPLPDGAPGDVRAYTKYSVFLGLALVFGAIAIAAVGRYDSEEKTIIPAKK